MPIKFVSSHSSRNINTESLYEATAADTYILRGDPANETYEPTSETFSIIYSYITFHSF